MMLYTLLVAVIICIAVWLYVTWLRVKNFWAVRGVPYVPPNPIVGSLTFLQRQNPAIWLRHLYDINNPYVGIWFFWRPGLVINSPEIARRVLIKDFNNFRNRYLSSGDKDPIGGLNLFTCNDPLWTSLRTRLSAVFTAAKLKHLQDYIMTRSKELGQRINNDKSKPINVRNMYVDFATDVIGTTAFGIESNATLTGEGAMRAITHDFGKFSLFRGLSWCSIFFFPDVVDIFGFTFFPKSSTEYFRKVFKMVAKNREENAIQTGDLLDALIKLKKEKLDDDKDVSEDMVISQAAIFLFGGFETSGSILSFITYELAFNPELQEKLHQELLEAKQRIGDNDFDAELLSKMTYLNCCIKEGLRKYSPMGWIDRIALSDYKIDDKLTIKAGTPIYVNSVGMHNDPEYFPQPEIFDPDRFSPENEKNIKQYTYMPFGLGPRFCIGQRFALMTVRFALSSVFLKFSLRPSASSPKPSDIKIDNRCLLYVAGEPLVLEFTPRT